MSDLSDIRKRGITLEVITEWAPWGPCEKCKRRRGLKTSRGSCRLKRTLEEVFPLNTLLNHYNQQFFLFNLNK